MGYTRIQRNVSLQARHVLFLEWCDSLQASALLQEELDRQMKERDIDTEQFAKQLEFFAAQDVNLGRLEENCGGYEEFTEQFYATINND